MVSRILFILIVNDVKNTNTAICRKSNDGWVCTSESICNYKGEVRCNCVQCDLSSP